MLAMLAGTAAAADPRRPTVVELFTSQGCSSCPPANANLARLSRRPDVLALSFGVTYWDRLGWKDVFARPEYTARQQAYEPPLGHDGPFTPQIVVDGRADVVGNELGPLEAAIGASRRGDGPQVALDAGTVRIGAGRAPAGGADIWLVRYDPHVVEVAVRAGENSGRTLPHKNVVHALTRLGTWRGEALSLPLRAAGDLSTAVLVQAPNGGQILGAVTD
ncbi:DUF1223 domain-containing protein [Labrys wisconsinensis]|uniref:DUF1223 domain-containing protein n=1 Tax=Labrys wisconsinensis TaxID=425677 RepID=A0ABU0JFE8_9HYPH|nr:DUF1223 domain-containing protein [Labrys wisconsinensis]MDQ0473000.1 hypothetical protein [Labrys wisconsinensis]